MPNNRPQKRVFVPEPPTEGEQLAWQVADATGQSLQQIHSQLIASQAEVVELQQRIQRITARWSMLTSNLEESLAESVARVSDDNLTLRELVREWRDAFEQSNVRAIPDLKRRTEELGL